MHHGKRVNFLCATRGVNNITVASDALTELIQDGLVKQSELTIRNMTGKKQTVTLYCANCLK